MGKKWTAIIIDDEKSAIEVLQELLVVYVPEVSVLGVENDLFAGLKMVNELEPDILFLDIEMPSGTGFDFLDHVKYHGFKLIFTTAHSQYAIQAIKRGVHDFLMKPIDIDELVDSINRLTEENGTESPLEEERLAVQCLDKIHLLDVKDIVRCESDSNYTHIKMSAGNRITVAMTLKSIESKLSNTKFVRVHQSHLVNKNKIMEITRGEHSELVLVNGERIPVSHRKKYLIKTLI